MGTWITYTLQLPSPLTYSLNCVCIFFLHPFLAWLRVWLLLPLPQWNCCGKSKKSASCQIPWELSVSLHFFNTPSFWNFSCALASTIPLHFPGLFLGLMSSTSPRMCYSLGFCPLCISLPRLSPLVVILLVTCTVRTRRSPVLTSHWAPLPAVYRASDLICSKLKLLSHQMFLSFPIYTISISGSTAHLLP